MPGDPYSDPVTGVLFNRLGLTKATDLEHAERDITRAASILLEERPVAGGFDLAHLKTVHAVIFRDIYSWAGQIRTVAIAKGSLFCLPQHIESYADDVFRALKGEAWLRNLKRDAFVERLTYYFGEVNALHPFREGNGRAQRAFFRELTRQAGYLLNLKHLDAEQNVTASIAITRGDPEPMRRMLDDLVEEP